MNLTGKYEKSEILNCSRKRKSQRITVMNLKLNMKKPNFLFTILSLGNLSH